MSTYLHSYYGFSQNSLLIVLKHIVLLFTSIWNDISVTFSFFSGKEFMYTSSVWKVQFEE